MAACDVAVVQRGRAVAVALACAAALLVATPVAAEPDLTPVRVAGGDRIETSAALGTAAGTAVLALADDWPDALAAAGLAGAVDGPVLLTSRDELPEITAEALDRFGVDRVLVLGGEAAVSAAVTDDLRARGYAVERVAGADRYATAAEAARRMTVRAPETATAQAPAEQPETGTARAPADTVVVANGESFADALAAGAPAFAGPWPILLTTAAALPPTTAAALDELAPARAIVLGGTAAISEAVERNIAARGIATIRVAGANREQTATRLADWWEADRDAPATRVVLVRGDGYADALAAGPFAGRTGAPILLAPAAGPLGDATEAWLRARCGGSIDAVQVAGGPAAVGTTALDDALRASRVCDQDAGLARFSFSVAADPATGTDAGAFAAEVAGILVDERGFTQPGRLELTGAGEGADIAIRLITEGTRRDGRDLLIDAGQWRQGLPDERARILNDLLAHWFGSGHLAGPWPTPAERDQVLDRYAPRVTVALAGDVHGEGVVRNELLAGNNPLAPMAPVLAGADLAIVNLETAVGSRGRPADKTFTFQAPPQLVTAVAGAGVDVVSLANNHALDYGVEALEETRSHAIAAGLRVVGAGRNAEEAYAAELLEVDGRTVAVLGLSRVLSPGWAATATRPGLASAYDEDAAVAAVRAAAAQADLVVVAIHWGVELDQCPDANQLRLAGLLTDAGADVIAGHHPHILQGVQSRGDALVAYSLGNFVWYHRRAPSRFTGVLTATLPGGSWTLAPAEIDGRGSPQPADAATAAAIHRAVAARSPGGGCAY